MRSAHLKYLSEARVKQRWWRNSTYRLRYWNIWERRVLAWERDLCCNNTYRLRYEPQSVRQQRSKATMRSTHRLPERREGKTKAISNSTYCLRYWNPFTINKLFMRYSCCNNTYRLRYWNTIVSTGISHIINSVAITPTVYGMRRRVRDGRGAKRRWGPHISSTWTKRR